MKVDLCSVITSLQNSGVPAEHIIIALKDLAGGQAQKAAEQREAARQRQAKKRERDKLLKNINSVTVTSRDTRDMRDAALHGVTPPSSPLAPPSDGFPDPSLTPPFNPPSALLTPSSPKTITCEDFAALTTFSLPDWIPQPLWDDFMEMRKLKKAKNTIRAKELLVRKLEGFKAKGHDPTAVIEKSITSSWIDVFEPKENFNAKPNTRPAARHTGFEQQDYTAGTEGFIV